MTDSREDSYDRANIPIAVQGVAAVAVFRYSPQPQPSTVAFSKARFRISANEISYFRKRPRVHRSEVLANLTTPMKALAGIVERGELAELLARNPRPARPESGAHRRLSAADVDQLVADYRSGVGSIYDLADLYGVHRNSIAQRLKQRGVRLGRLPLQASEAERARELHTQGLSLNAIGRALGRDPKTVRTSLQ